MTSNRCSVLLLFTVQGHTLKIHMSLISFVFHFYFDFLSLLHLAGRHIPDEAVRKATIRTMYNVLFRLLYAAPYLKNPAFLNVQAGGFFMKPIEIACPKMDKLQATN